MPAARKRRSARKRPSRASVAAAGERVRNRFLGLMQLYRISGMALSKLIPMSQQGLSAYTAGRRRIIQPVLDLRLRQMEVAHIAAQRVDTNSDITDLCDEGKEMTFRDFALHAPSCVQCYTQLLYRAEHAR